MQEEDAEEQLEKLQEQLSEVVSRLRRIRTIKKKVQQRAEEAFQRGLQEMEEEVDGGLLPALESHERWVVNDLSALGVQPDADFALFGLGMPDGTGGAEAAHS